MSEQSGLEGGQGQESTQQEGAESGAQGGDAQTTETTTTTETSTETEGGESDQAGVGGDALNEQGGPQGIQAETEADGTQHAPSEPLESTASEHPTRDQREADASAAHEAERAADRQRQEEATRD